MRTIRVGVPVAVIALLLGFAPPARAAGVAVLLTEPATATSYARHTYISVGLPSTNLQVLGSPSGRGVSFVEEEGVIVPVALGLTQCGLGIGYADCEQGAVSVVTGAGADMVTLVWYPSWGLAASISTGAGDDRITVHGGGATIDCGLGADVLVGAAGVSHVNCETVD